MYSKEGGLDTRINLKKQGKIAGAWMSETSKTKQGGELHVDRV
jgi:hypothetical protein